MTAMLPVLLDLISAIGLTAIVLGLLRGLADAFGSEPRTRRF
jgi:hypothetical protein